MKKKVTIVHKVFLSISIVLLLFQSQNILNDANAANTREPLQTQPHSIVQQFLWAGANAYAIYNANEQERLQLLNAMQRAQISVLRIFLTYSFEEPIGSYNEHQLQKVDKLMAECQTRGIKLIVAFENQLDGVYVRTYGPVDMYRDEAAIAAYKQRITYFLNHRNPYLENKGWKELNDVVLAWEIQNEPGTPLLEHMLHKYYRSAQQQKLHYNTSLEQALTMNAGAKHRMMRNYLDQIASHIKSVDPDTYVALGAAGDSNYYHPNGGRGDDLRSLGNISAADIYTLHFYGGELDAWLDDHIDYVRGMGKLLLIEEFVYEGEGITNDLKYDFFQTVTRICRLRGIPWMFWHFGLLPDGSDPARWYLYGNIRQDTKEWEEIIVPEAHAISQEKTPDPWHVRTAPSESSISLSKSLLHQ